MAGIDQCAVQSDAEPHKNPDRANVNVTVGAIEEVNTISVGIVAIVWTKEGNNYTVKSPQHDHIRLKLSTACHACITSHYITKHYAITSFSIILTLLWINTTSWKMLKCSVELRGTAESGNNYALQFDPVLKLGVSHTFTLSLRAVEVY